MNRFAKVLVALCFATGLTACGGGGYSGFILPQESELKPWVAPEAEDLLPADGSEDAGDEGDYEDYEDYEDEEDEDAAAPAAAPSAPAKPAAK